MVRGNNIALILFASATLKAKQLAAHSTFVVPGPIHFGIVAFALIQAELLLAAWLFIGGFPRARFITATTAFTFFAAISAYEALHALPSCGCFGNLKVPPLLTCAFDLSAVTTLYFTRPPFKVKSPPFDVERCVLSVAFPPPAPSSLPQSSPYPPSPSGPPSSFTALPTPLHPLIPPAASSSSNPKNGSTRPSPCSTKSKPAINSATANGSSFSTTTTATPASKPSPNTYGWPTTNPPPQLTPHRLHRHASDGRPRLPNYFHSTLRPTHDWFATTPVLAILDNGQVQSTTEGEKALHPSDYSNNMIK